MYDESPRHRWHFQVERPGRLEEAVRAVRLGLEPHTAWIPGVAGRVSNAVRSVTTFTVESFHFLREPPATFYPRLGFIGGAGLLGLLVTLRGSRARRWLYAGSATALAASVCYPESAVSLAQAGAEKTLAASVAAVTWGASLWKAAPQQPQPLQPQQQQPQQQQQQPLQPLQQQQPHAHPATAGVTPPAAGDTEGSVETPTGKVPAHAVFQPDPQLSDHGQANAADRDLYTTRSQH
ncbi:MICOS complex subunit MIC27-like [Petromyzon marinus]|uniref:MICOS complex subunit MIC27-like n=1 Tax=Petromyzon marinus TaxID=7757 RepID=UPI003F6FCFAE